MKNFKIVNGELVKYTGNETDITIPNSVTSIGDYAFSGCKKLTSMTAECIENIGEQAFAYTRLQSPEGKYKAFRLHKNGSITCLSYLYTPGQWSDPIDCIKLCRTGYHYCANLFEIFNYYSGKIV